MDQSRRARIAELFIHSRHPLFSFPSSLPSFLPSLLPPLLSSSPRSLPSCYNTTGTRGPLQSRWKGNRLPISTNNHSHVATIHRFWNQVSEGTHGSLSGVNTKCGLKKNPTIINNKGGCYSWLVRLAPARRGGGFPIPLPELNHIPPLWTERH